MKVETVWQHLPEIFLKTYEREIMLWATRVDEPTLKIRLFRKPGAADGELDISHIQEFALLTRQAFKHPVSGEMKVMVAPVSGFDIEIIELHCQRLPGILGSRAAAARAWARRGGHMAAQFERIPDAFVEHYNYQFRVWGSEFRQRGPRCAIVFDLAPGASPELDGEGRPMMKGAWFEAYADWSRPDNPRLVIMPVDEANEELIARHTREMAGHWLS